ncbi:MAG: P-loop NTPase [bacterium]
MARVISVHSFRGGTGESNIAGSLAIALALQGRRVAVVDTDIQSPGIHILFGVAEDRMSPALNDLLWGRCSIEAAAHDVSATRCATPAGACCWFRRASRRARSRGCCVRGTTSRGYSARAEARSADSTSRLPAPDPVNR